MSKKVKKVGILTAGGLAPCLSASIGYLIKAYTRKAPKVEIICYVNGYMGLLQGKEPEGDPARCAKLEGSSWNTAAAPSATAAREANDER